jgi:predicted negative regulator of RcsB-dependent stress response
MGRDRLCSLREKPPFNTSSRATSSAGPLSFIVNNDVCRILYFARRFDEALAQCKANLDMDPELRRSLWRMGSIYAAMGEEKEAASTFVQAFQNAISKAKWTKTER